MAAASSAAHSAGKNIRGEVAIIELVLVYCLSSDPDRCLQKREIREPVGSAIECTLKAQTEAQRYVASHPRYRLQGWRCEVDRPAEAPA